VKGAIGNVKAVSTSDEGNVPSEAYNLVFEKSVSDTSLGWRYQSRKVVVVLGDAEPHSAGPAGLSGCRDTNVDTHGLNTMDVLARMRAAGRTLVMVRQAGVDTSLECYNSIAALAAPGGAARNAGASDLAGPIRSLLQGTGVAFEVSRGFPLALPHTQRALVFSVQNRSGKPFLVESMTLNLPPGTRFISASTQFGETRAKSGTVVWRPDRPLPAGRSTSVIVHVRLGAPARVAFRAGIVAILDSDDTSTTSITGDGAIRVAVAGVARLRVSRTLAQILTSDKTATAATGRLHLTYPISARTLDGPTSADGVVTIGRGRSRVEIRIDSAHVSTRGAATVTARGHVTFSGRTQCARGQRVGVRLVDYDALAPSVKPDLMRSAGSGCTLAGSGDIVTR
jgi:hypothetical protein